MRVLFAAILLLALTACDMATAPVTEPTVTEEAKNPCKGLDEAACVSIGVCEWKAGARGDTKKCKPKA